MVDSDNRVNSMPKCPYLIRLLLLFSLKFAKSKLRSIFPCFLTAPHAQVISCVGLHFLLSPLLGHLFVVIARAVDIGSVKISSK